MAFVIHNFSSVVFLLMPLYLLLGTIWVIRNKDQNFEVLSLLIYTIGFEMIFRMKSDGAFFDIGKYAVIYFSILGFGFKKISLKAWPYFLILILFVPGIYLTVNTFFFQIDVRKKILFNLLGPFSLVAASLYCYGKFITLEDLIKRLKILTGPLLTILFLVILYTPSDFKELVRYNTSSNFAASGGFGPNQISTILGLGCFVYYVAFLTEVKDKILKYVFLGIFAIFLYRGLLTFSRGGMITFFVMFAFFNFKVFKILNNKARTNYLLVLFGLIVTLTIVWIYASVSTNGMIVNRYSNKDAAGRLKESSLSGREDIMSNDLELFIENPVFGVGPGIGGMIRGEGSVTMGAQAHSEPSRLLSEHGVFGLFILLFLIFVPIIKYYRDRNFYHIFFFSFLIFWGLTINHAATRIVASSVVYALALLNIYLPTNTNSESIEQNPVHRE